MTPMVLASAYLGGAYFFVRVLREPRWNVVKTGFLSVALFASLLGVATIVHWDKFNHGHGAFWLWAGLYFAAPFLVFGGWLANRRFAAPAGVDETRLGAIFCLGSAGIGVLVDPRWTTVRLMLQVEALMVALILIGAGRGGAGVRGVRHWPTPDLADVRRLRRRTAGIDVPLVHHGDPARRTAGGHDDRAVFASGDDQPTRG